MKEILINIIAFIWHVCTYQNREVRRVRNIATADRLIAAVYKELVERACAKIDANEQQYRRDDCGEEKSFFKNAKYCGCNTCRKARV
jgi:hypothetical protein